MPPRRSSRGSRGQEPDSNSNESEVLFRGGLEEEHSGDSAEARQVEDDLGITGGSQGGSSAIQEPSAGGLIDVEMEDAAAPSIGISEPTIQEEIVSLPKSDEKDETIPQLASTMEEDLGANASIEKGKKESTLSRDEPLESSNASSGELLASLPVYFNTSLSSSSTLQVFQYPTYPRGHPLPFPQSARERGLQPAMRTRPRAKRVEIELPLDLRPPVYNADRGEEFGEGAAAAGTFGPLNGVNPPALKTGERRIKSEFGGYQSTSTSSSSSDKNQRKTLEKTRLESNVLPHQTQYMLGVVRNRAVHLTPVESIHQLRPSMHYIDALEAMKRQQDKALEEQRTAGEETDEVGGRPNGSGNSSTRQRKIQNLNVSIRNDSSGVPQPNANRQGGSTNPIGGNNMAGGVGDSRDFLMQAEREAESERWVSLDWRIDENSDEARKTFESQLLAIDKTTRLQCKTKPREYLQM